MEESCTGFIKPGNKATLLLIDPLTLLPYSVTMAGANLDGSKAQNSGAKVAHSIVAGPARRPLN